jgi:hypothetical protein
MLRNSLVVVFILFRVKARHHKELLWNLKVFIEKKEN